MGILSGKKDIITECFTLNKQGLRSLLLNGFKPMLHQRNKVPFDTPGRQPAVVTPIELLFHLDFAVPATKRLHQTFSLEDSVVLVSMRLGVNFGAFGEVFEDVAQDLNGVLNRPDIHDRTVCEQRPVCAQLFLVDVLPFDNTVQMTVPVVPLVDVFFHDDSAGEDILVALLASELGNRIFKELPAFLQIRTVFESEGDKPQPVFWHLLHERLIFIEEPIIVLFSTGSAGPVLAALWLNETLGTALAAYDDEFVPFPWRFTFWADVKLLPYIE